MHIPFTSEESYPLATDVNNGMIKQMLSMRMPTRSLVMVLSLDGGTLYHDSSTMPPGE